MDLINNINRSTFYSDVPIEDGTEHSQVVTITLFVAVLCLCLVVGHLLNEYRWVNESITAIIIVRNFSINYISLGCFPMHGLATIIISSDYLHFENVKQLITPNLP